MDFTQIDKIIGTLEKKASARPGSPPVVINGHLGVWRTVRHNRMFLELLNGGKTQGKVLIGPPSMVGRELGDVPSEVWAGLTPKATLKEFSDVDVASNGIETLKQSIKDAVGPDDTRRQAVENFTTKLQLVPIARSAGFTDDEIKAALAGNSPNTALDQKDGEPAEAPEGLPKTKLTAVQGRKVEENLKPETAEKPTAPEGVPPTKTVTPAPGATKPAGNSDTDYIQDALARVLQPSKVSDSEANAAKVGALLVKLSKTNITDKLLAKEVEKVGNGLRSGDYNLTDAKEKLKSIVEDRERAKRNVKVTDEQLEALNDRAEIKEFVDGFDAKLEQAVTEAVQRVSDKFKPKEEAKPEPVTVPKPEAPTPTPVAAPVPESARRQESLSRVTESQKESAQTEAILNLLEILQKNLQSAKALEQVEALKVQVKSGQSNKRSIILKLYQLLQILSLLVPGL